MDVLLDLIFVDYEMVIKPEVVTHTLDINNCYKSCFFLNSTLK